jgi:antitoxin component of MazEF toxin-antitoxin module
MKVENREGHLAVRLPERFVRALDLKEGDEANAR